MSLPRSADSHKGDNGTVAIVGGSRLIHGAPLLSALAAEASGVDLVFVCVPACHEEIAKATALNFQVHPFHGDDLAERDIQPIVELLATIDCAVIGPGIARTRASVAVLERIIAEATCPLVLDATALQPSTLSWIAKRDAVLTPHLGELERMGLAPDDLPMACAKHDATVLLKDHIDRVITTDGSTREIPGGNAGLTVGGTGDALAGLVAGLRAQHVPSGDACIMASTIIKRAGTLLYEKQGYAYTAQQVIGQIPHLLHTFG